MQTELLFNDARLWTLTICYQEYVRCRGVMATRQVREHRKFPGSNEAEARQAARDWIREKFFQEYNTFGRDITNIQDGQSLTRSNTLNITAAVPY